MKKSRKLKGEDHRSLTFRSASILACCLSFRACLRDLRGGGFRFDCRGDFLCTTFVSYSWGSCDPERVRVISIARLRTLPPMHLQPIDVIVFDDPCVEILS